MNNQTKNKSLNNDSKNEKLQLKAKNLFFNLINRVFKKTSIDSNILEQNHLTTLISILSKKGEKTNEEMKVVNSYLNEIDFFSKLNIEDQKSRDKIVNNLKLKGFSKGEYIINEEDEGNLLVLILYGNISRFVSIPYSSYINGRDYINYVSRVINEEKNLNKVKRLEEYNKSKYEIMRINLLQNINYDIKKVTFDVNFYGEFFLETPMKTHNYESKDLLGENLFFNKTINNEISYFIADSDCIVISLDKKEYIKIIDEMNHAKLNNLSKVLKENFPIFKNWNKPQLNKLIFSLKKVIFKKDNVIYVQNSAPDYIYFTFQGKMESTVTLDIKSYKQYFDFINLKNDNILTQIKKWSLEKNHDILNKFSK